MKFVEKWAELESVLSEEPNPIKTRTASSSYVKPSMELLLIFIYKYYGIYANAVPVSMKILRARGVY